MPEAKGVRLVKRGGVYYIVWTGNSRGRTTRTGDRAVAEAALAAFIQSRDADAGDQRARLTVAQALAYYLEEHVNVVRADGTRRVEAHERLYAHKKDGEPTGIIPNLAAHFGPLVIADITDDDVAEYGRRRRAGQVARRAGDGTIRRELGCLVAAINHNLRANVRPRRLSRDDVPTIRLPDAPQPKQRVLERDEAERLYVACLGGDALYGDVTAVYLFCKIALATAARKRAIEALTIFQVDLERRTIDFNPPGRRQTKKRRALVPISDDLLPIIRAAVAHAKASGSEYVLGGCGDTRRHFNAACAAAKLAGVTPHTLRHTWATWAARAGVPMWDIAGVLGDGEATVRKNYAHHSPEYLRGAVNFGKESGDGGARASADNTDSGR